MAYKKPNRFAKNQTRNNMNANDRDKMRKEIMSRIRENPGITETRLIELIGRSDSVVTPFLHKLVNAGAIEIGKAKRRWRAYYIKGEQEPDGGGQKRSRARCACD